MTHYPYSLIWFFPIYSLAAFIIGILLEGCVTPQERWSFPFGTVIYASPAEVNYQCCVKATHWDDGTIMDDTSRCSGCTDYDAMTSWIKWQNQAFETTMHELCHLSTHAINGNDCKE